MTTKPNGITPEELTAIRERAEDAKVWSSSYDCSEQMAMIRCNFEHYHMIARASTDIPRLLDALEAAYAENERLRSALTQIGFSTIGLADESASKLRKMARDAL
jgi:leucyl aminopeptidase